VMHRDAARVAFRDRVLQRLGSKNENEQRQTAAIGGVCGGQTTRIQSRAFNVH
jgi:hypothetical protein